MSRRRQRNKGGNFERLCLGCRRYSVKRTLLRVSVLRDGQVVVDFSQNKGGRGAYVCPTMDCLIAAFKGKRWHHALRRAVPDIVGLMRLLAKEAIWMTGNLPPVKVR
ncbi:hypothetical protein HRbin17_01572 [bacterium HR17]|jgi:predicted RNA-binding protein YlxR (DUF448 family)|uniref:YlxR domain-containing protein n=1 Tax=Candidatus Fervidibacter japonicus TaxID=2035412 RepID=A0A2H5XCY9_9BACT|nr:hypothetical protein HRbin17_01572 [bacterium HR17]